jgi:hypothetical protein
MGFISIVLIIIAFICAFFSGLLLGCDAIHTVRTTIITTCDSCQRTVGNDEPLYCEDCSFEDNLNSALKDKEMSSKYAQIALKQRNLINRPKRDELENILQETNHTEELCTKLKEISKDLNVDIDITQLQTSNENLRECVKKWNEFDKREEAINKMISQ